MVTSNPEEAPNHKFPPEKTITGTLVWYYAICKREVWLMSHAITPDQNHQALDFGRAIHEIYYRTMKKEVKMEGIKIDVIKGGKESIICEVKTSSKFLEAARLQLAYYLYRLEEAGVKVRGEILVPREKRRIKLTLNEETRRKIKNILKEIVEICSKPLPPPPAKIPFCKKCAYSDFCWGDQF